MEVFLKESTIPVWEKYNLTINEATQYFHIGDTKLRRILDENPDADYILYNGAHRLIKRRKFEDYIDRCEAI